MCVCLYGFFIDGATLVFFPRVLDLFKVFFLLRTYGKSLSNHHLREYVLELFLDIEESHGHLTLADWDVC